VNFEPSDIQRDLRDLAARVFDSETVPGADGDIRDAWRRYAEAGLIGITLSDRFGGAGLGAQEECIVLEEGGRALAAGPLIEALAILPVIERHAEAQAARWLPEVVRGAALLVPAMVDVGEPLRATAIGDGWEFHGAVSAVAHAPDADAFLAIALSERGPVSAIVARDAPGLGVSSQQGIDLRPCGLVRFDRVSIAAEAVLGSGDPAEIAEALTARIRVAAAASQLGIAAEALRRTAEYVSQREQFGAPLAAKQAVRQRLADAFIDVEAMRSTLWRAAWALDTLPDPAADVAVAKYWAASGGHRVVHAAQHLHGGIGADVSYPIHRYFLAAARIGLILGGAEPILAELGRAIADGRAESLT
jgi:alkylation response protein AidB-like acyl-CoA dehydrogenase